MTKGIVVIAAGILLAGSGLWRSYCDEREQTSASETQAARLLARDPALKLVSEDSPYMRTER